MKKKMKKSFLLPLIGIIAVITIVGVGFAAWAIISPINLENKGGNITAEQLVDRTFTITATPTNENIVFGKSTVENLPTDAWFRDDSSAEENLTATLTITLKPTEKPTDWTNADINTYLDGRTINVKLATDKYDEFNTAIGANYLVLPTLLVNSRTSALTDDWSGDNLITLNLAGDDFVKGAGDTDENKVFTATVTVKFAWGTATGGTNPYEYFNNGTEENKYSNENVTKAKNVCGAVYALNNATYTISFEAVPKTNA